MPAVDRVDGRVVALRRARTARCLLLALLAAVVGVLLCACLVVLAAAAVMVWGTTTAPPVVPTEAPAPALVPQVPAAVAFETAARLDAAVVPIHDPIALRELLLRDSVALPAPASPYQVGDRRRFQMDGASQEAELVHVTDHVYVWLTGGTRADRPALIAAGDRFEAEIYPTVRRYFGSEWSPGIDGDVHLSILHYADSADDTAGSFAPYDELPRDIDPESNEMEMFYVNLDGMDPGEEYYFATLAHEFQHMIQWQSDRNEADWLDEGLAELACRLAGFDPGSYDRIFRDQPDIPLASWPYEGDTAPHYGASYRFALYLFERFGEPFIWDLAHEPANGMRALDATLAAHGQATTADDVFADWAVANAVDTGEYTYELDRWSGSVGMDATHRDYPAARETTVSPYGTDYVDLSGTGRLSLSFQGTSQVPLLPVAAHSGDTAWWSNSGNRSDMHLTRRFDLSTLSSATLRFWTWYELEDGYDFVYLSASDDNGETWSVLRGDRSTQEGEYGWSYGGLSHGWREETLDLSAYAGGEVWVRFDYVTDDTINEAGFLLDDVAIDELGWVDPCEEEGDWQAEGFVLAGQMVPVRWAVQLVEFSANGGPARVRRLDLDERQAGQMDLDLGGDVESALLAISALVRGTTEPAAYAYQITPR